MAATIEIPQPVRVLSDELILVDWGPMTLTISAWVQSRPRPVIAAKAARHALAALQTLSDFKNFLKRPVRKLPRGRKLPRVVERAYAAVGKISGELTPMAAVAGAVADQVADAAVDLGAGKVIVNNGGDIAVRMAANDGVVVGLKPGHEDKMIGRLSLAHSHGIGGIASSGWRGRSHSPGVADIVSVWAQSTALADAVATFIAGKTAVVGQNISKVRADALDPRTDLTAMPVTTDVGWLSVSQRAAALDGGLAAAQEIFSQGRLCGCYLSVQGDHVVLDPDGILDID